MAKQRRRPWRPPEAVLVQEQIWETVRADEIRNVDSGQTHTERCLLILSRNLAPEAEGETWLHELLHACWSHTGLPASKAQSHEETVIRALSPILWAALRRNRLRFDR